MDGRNINNLDYQGLNLSVLGTKTISRVNLYLLYCNKDYLPKDTLRIIFFYMLHLDLKIAEKNIPHIQKIIKYGEFWEGEAYISGLPHGFDEIKTLVASSDSLLQKWQSIMNIMQAIVNDTGFFAPKIKPFVREFYQATIGSKLDIFLLTFEKKLIAFELWDAEKKKNSVSKSASMWA